MTGIKQDNVPEKKNWIFTPRLQLGFVVGTLHAESVWAEVAKRAGKVKKTHLNVKFCTQEKKTTYMKNGLPDTA